MTNKFPDRAVAIITKDEKILIFSRYMNRKKYFCLPGGSIEKNETPEQTLVRECKEEMNIAIQDYQQKFVLTNQERMEYYFTIEKFSGNLKLIGPEMIPFQANNQYWMVWVKFTDIPSLEQFYPKAAKAPILKLLKM